MRFGAPDIFWVIGWFSYVRSNGPGGPFATYSSVATLDRKGFRVDWHSLGDL
jgi:hypothetical protein